MEYNHDDIQSISTLKSFISEYIPGEIIKKEIQIVAQNDFIELIRIEYFTQFYSVEKLNNDFIKNNLSKDKKLSTEIIKGKIGIKEDKEFIEENNINDNIIKKFKQGKKVIIIFNSEEKEKDNKTIISYVIVNKKPFMNKFSFNIKYRQDCKEIVDNSIMTQNLQGFFISEKSYKVITYIQRKSLNNKFFESDDIVGELKTSYVNEDEFQSFFSPIIK